MIDVSVVVPAKNEEAVIGQQLEALATQKTDEPWELVVADNGSTDRTREIVESFRARLPSLRVVDASQRPGASYARNAGVAAAAGSRILFCDADDVVDPAWVAAMSRRLRTCRLVSGTSLHVEGAIDPRRFAGEFPAEPPRHAGWRECALGCNLAVRREVFDELGGFDLHVEGADDIDLCWRAVGLGVDLCFEPEARCLKARRTGSSRVWRQHYHYGRADYRLRRRFRAEGCPQPSRVVVRSAGWLVLHLADVLRAERRRTWLVVAARTSGMVVQSLGDLGSASADIADTGR